MASLLLVGMQNKEEERKKEKLTKKNLFKASRFSAHGKLSLRNHIKNIAIIFIFVAELNYKYLVLTRLELKKKKEFSHVNMKCRNN